MLPEFRHLPIVAKVCAAVVRVLWRIYWDAQSAHRLAEIPFPGEALDKDGVLSFCCPRSGTISASLVRAVLPLILVGKPKERRLVKRQAPGPDPFFIS